MTSSKRIPEVVLKRCKVMIGLFDKDASTFVNFSADFDQKSFLRKFPDNLESEDRCCGLNDRLSSLTLREQGASFVLGGHFPEERVKESDSMPLRRRRASPSVDDHRASKRARPSSKKSSSRDVDSFSSKRCIAWFHEYTGPDEDTILPEGMEKFCEDIGVEPENIVMLSLAFKLDARNMGFFTLAEWLKGMTDLGCDNTTKLQSKLDYLRSLLDDTAIFKNIYRYAFDFARDKQQRSMDIDLAKAMLQLLLGKHWSLCGSFHQFLEQSKTYKVINKDQWCNVLEFSRTIKPDLSNYDEDGAWPVMLDEFVDWNREQNRPDHQMS